MKSTKILSFLVVLAAAAFFTTQSFSDDKKPQESAKAAAEKALSDSEKEPEMAGQLFGVPIPTGNYYFVLKTVTTFGTPWGGIPENEKQLEKRVQDDLLMSYESFRRNISVTQDEINEETTKTLKEYKVDFDWTKDKEAYAKWTKDSLGGESVEFFENQMRHLIQLRKLQKEIMDDINPVITDQEAFQEFLNEYNTLSIELVQFDEPKDAEKFYKQAKANKKFWDKEKEKSPDKFKRPGFVALEFLMYMWQLPKDAVYDMITKDIGTIYPPTPIYRGKGVFKVLEIRRADESQFPKLKDSYYQQLTTQKKYDGFSKWLEDQRKESNIRIDLPLPKISVQENKS